MMESQKWWHQCHCYFVYSKKKTSFSILTEKLKQKKIYRLMNREFCRFCRIKNSLRDWFRSPSARLVPRPRKAARISWNVILQLQQAPVKLDAFVFGGKVRVSFSERKGRAISKVRTGPMIQRLQDLASVRASCTAFVRPRIPIYRSGGLILRGGWNKSTRFYSCLTGILYGDRALVTILYATTYLQEAKGATSEAHVRDLTYWTVYTPRVLILLPASEPYGLNSSTANFSVYLTVRDFETIGQFKLHTWGRSAPRRQLIKFLAMTNFTSNLR